MSKLVKPLAFIASIALAAPVSAQVGSLSDGTINQGAQPSQAPAPESEFTSEKIGAWDLQCAKAGPEPRPCRMHQVLLDKEGNSVAEATIYRLPEGAPAAGGITFMAPLTTLLPTGLAVSIDGVLVQRVPFDFCYQAGCLSRMGLSPIEAQAFQNGENATVTVVPAYARNTVVTATMSLDGLKEAFEKAVPFPEE